MAVRLCRRTSSTSGSLASWRPSWRSGASHTPVRGALPPTAGLEALTAAAAGAAIRQTNKLRHKYLVRAPLCTSARPPALPPAATGPVRTRTARTCLLFGESCSEWRTLARKEGGLHVPAVSAFTTEYPLLAGCGNAAGDRLLRYRCHHRRPAPGGEGVLLRQSVCPCSVRKMAGAATTPSALLHTPLP